MTSSIVNGAAEPGIIDAQVRELVYEGAPLYALNESLIRELRPDLIFTQALCDVCAVMETDVRSLAARLAPVPQVVALSATTLDGVFDDIARAAAALHLEDEAEELLAGMRARLASVHGTLKAATAPRPRVAMIEWTDPIYAGGHWVPEMIRRAGGSDVVAKPGDHSHVVTLKTLAAANPEIVIVAPCGHGLERAKDAGRRLLAQPELRLAASVQLWALDGNSFTSRPGPRLVDGVEALARIFNPLLFSPLDDSVAARLN